MCMMSPPKSCLGGTRGEVPPKKNFQNFFFSKSSMEIFPPKIFSQPGTRGEDNDVQHFGGDHE